MTTTYTVKIKTITIAPVTVSSVQQDFKTFQDADNFVKAFLMGQPNCSDANVLTRYDNAKKRYAKTGRTPCVYTHPNKGTILRHLILITKNTPIFEDDYEGPLFNDADSGDGN